MTRIAALLLLHQEHWDVKLVGGDQALAGDCRAAAVVAHKSPRCEAGGWGDAAGADVVVLLDEPVSDLAREAHRRCPGAVMLVGAGPAAHACRNAYTAFGAPRGKVLGVRPVAVPGGREDPGPAALAEAVAKVARAVALDLRQELTCTVLGSYDGGTAEVEFASRRVKVGRAGVAEL